MDRHTQLIGRHAEIRDVAEVLRAAGTARTLLVTGPAGSGKTAVVQEATRMVAADGGRVLRLDWAGDGQPPGAATLGEAVGRLLSRVQDGRLPARLAAVRRAQERLREGGSGAELALLSVLGETLADAARHAPFAVVVDDAERIPSATASALRLMVRAFRPAGIPVVVAGRPLPADLPPGLPAFADRVLDLAPLSPEDIDVLISRRLGQPVEPDLRAAVRRSLGPLSGNPAAVLSVLDGLRGSDALLDLDGLIGLASPGERLRLGPDAPDLGGLLPPYGAPEEEPRAAAAALARLLHRAEVRLEDIHGGLPWAAGTAAGGLPGDGGAAAGGRDVDGEASPHGPHGGGAVGSRGLSGNGGPRRRPGDRGADSGGLSGDGEAGARRSPGDGFTDRGDPFSGGAAGRGGPGGGGFAGALDRLLRGGVLDVDQDGRLSFTVPALAEHLRTLPAGPDVRPVHAAVVRSSADRLGPASAGRCHPRLADHAAAAGPLLDGEVALPLLLAAARADTRTEPARAARAYRAALRRLPPDTPEALDVLREAVESARRNADHAAVLALTGPIAACLEARGDAGRADLAPLVRSWVLASLHEQRSPFGDTDGPASVLRAALERMPGAAAMAALGSLYGYGPGGQGTFTASPAGREPSAQEPPGHGPRRPAGDGADGRVGGELVAEPPGRPGPAGRPAPSGPPRRPPYPRRPCELQLLEPLGAGLRPGAAPLTAALRNLRAADARVLAAVPLLAAAAHGRAPSAWDDGAALVEAAAYGDFAGGLAVALGDEHALAGHGGAVRHHGMVRAYLDGDWDEALARAREIERLGRGGVPHGVRGPARALAAEMHTLRGDLGRARAWLALIPDTVAHPLVVRARLGVRYWSGPEGEAYAHTWRDFRRAVGEGRFAGAERVLLRILLFAVTSRPARPQEAWRALDRLAELHEEAPTVLTREALLAARGLLHRDEAAARAAHESARRRGDLPMTLYCCQALVEVADDPRPWLAETAAHSRRMAIGGPLRTLLGRSAQRRNARLPRHRSAPEGLGETDLRLIRMVSQGATNRQIAARLACSEKTVEQRLARLFQRTGSRSRVELAAAWLDGTLERAGSDVRTGTSASHPSP